MKKFILLIPVMFLSVLVLNCTQAGAQTSQKTWNLKMHHEQAETSPYQVYGHVPWAQDVEKATNGRVKITIYPMQTLMKSKDAWEGVKSRIADISWIFTGYFPGQMDLIDAITLPFMSPSGHVGSRVAWALYQKFPEIQAQVDDVKILTCWTSEPYRFITTKKQINTMADFSGLKLRMTGGPPTEMMKLLGGVPMMVPMPDNYENMQKGVTDGMAGPAEAILGYRLYEVVKYYCTIPTVCVNFFLIMNKKVWGEMPPDIQDAIMSVSGEKQAIRYGRDVFDGAYNSMPDVIKKAGYEYNVNTPPNEEVDKWIAVAGKPLWDDWVKRMEAKGHKVASQILAETLKLVEEYSK
ncbi:MAG: TRAP transporter substrate-binding protein [Deltaproteobacteria bacterium]|nr:TRAP transporter substrate-binding protein [Deltaproteobacteria bacterium]